jgi:hypothetical protein
MSKITVIDFHGHPLYTFEQDGQVYVVMRPIADALGLEWSAQYRRIQRDDVLTCVAIMATQILPGDDQLREVMALPIDFMNGWLFGITASKIRPEYREPLIQYKRESYRVLYEYWHGKQTMPMIQSMKYWDAKHPHWAPIKACAQQGLTNIQIAPLLPYPDGRSRSPRSVGSVLRRQFDVGYTNPVEIFSARLKPETAARWAIEKPVAAQWGKAAANQLPLFV